MSLNHRLSNPQCTDGQHSQGQAVFILPLFCFILLCIPAHSNVLMFAEQRCLIGQVLSQIPRF